MAVPLSEDDASDQAGWFRSNQIYDNVVMDATDLAIQSNALMPNVFQNNMTTGPSSNAGSCYTCHALRGR
ncbi:MAG: hypothetical protein ABJC09_12110 [Terriglobia bacterium]